MAIVLLIRSKKGIFFTLMSLLMISLIVLALRADSNVTLINKVPVVESRIQTANDYVKTLEINYIDRALFASSHGALNLYIQNISRKGTFPSSIVEVNNGFRELMMNGTLEGGKKLTNNSLSDLMNNITNLADTSLKIETDYTLGNSNIFQSNQTGPWKVGITLSMNFTINATVATWNISKNFTTTMSIVGFNDTYFPLNTMDSGFRVNRQIVPTDYAKWNVNRLIEHINEGTYTYENKSPSFLQRLINDSSPSQCCGIESLVNQNDGFNEGGPLIGGYLNVSFADYCYFGDGTNPNCGDTWRVTLIENESYPFRIDRYHYAKYNLTNLTAAQLYED